MEKDKFQVYVPFGVPLNWTLGTLGSIYGTGGEGIDVGTCPFVRESFNRFQTVC